MNCTVRISPDKAESWVPTHRSIAQFMGYGSCSAAVAGASVDARRQVTVHRLVLALDCGHAVNPQQIAAQVEGSVAYGLSAALFGEITIEAGRAKQRNFDSCPILRLAQMPKCRWSKP